MKPPDATGTQEVDLDDVELAAESAPVRAASRLPPPLPPSASIASSEPIRASQIPVSPSMVAPAPAARSPIFVVLLVVCVVVLTAGVAGVVIAMRKKPPAAATRTAQSAGAGPSVITIPVVDMNETDGGQ